MTKLVQDVADWGDKRGLKDTDDIQMKYQRFLQEAIEVHEALVLNDEEEFQDAIGDTLVTLIMLAKAKGYETEACLAKAFDVIKLRKGLTKNGQFIRYAKLSKPEQLICDTQQGNPECEYFLEDENLLPVDFSAGIFPIE